MKRIIFLFSIFFISSCGGGGSSSGSDNDSNFIIPATNSISENCETVSWNNKLERCDLIHNELERYYYIYKPSNLNINKSIPLLFALHGYGSTAQRYFSYTNYEPISDTNNLVVIYPQGYPMRTTLASSSSHWNSGGWTVGSDVDDVEFIDTVIDLVLK